ncbi:hypothetical protein ACMYR3_05255 [Ampullimonas aquatilis]|uniref:hypothetical protein n=1 Tax=Ampullimonas aquatilis TaxID=1341549 RepID=UPI003C70CABE
MTNETQTADTQLLDALQHFQSRMNASAPVQKMSKGWSPLIYVQSNDDAHCFALQIEEGQLKNITPSNDDIDEDDLLLRADHELLVRIFKGQANPLREWSNGTLEVYGPQKDQGKLDAVSMILWGL